MDESIREVQLPDGTHCFFTNGLVDHIVRPNGDREWYRNDVLHRERYPAVIRSNGSYEYWLDGQMVYELGGEG